MQAPGRLPPSSWKEALEWKPRGFYCLTQGAAKKSQLQGFINLLNPIAAVWTSNSISLLLPLILLIESNMPFSHLTFLCKSGWRCCPKPPQLPAGKESHDHSFAWLHVHNTLCVRSCMIAHLTSLWQQSRGRMRKTCKLVIFKIKIQIKRKDSGEALQSPSTQVIQSSISWGYSTLNQHKMQKYGPAYWQVG